MEQILWKIGVLQSDLGELKTRLKKVQDENAKDIYSADAMNTNAVRTSSAQNDVPTNEGRELVKVSSIASRHMPKSNMFMVKNETAISTHGKATNLIDITECNNQLQIAISGEKVNYQVCLLIIMLGCLPVVPYFTLNNMLQESGYKYVTEMAYLYCSAHYHW